MKRATIVAGPPGSGKSTWVAARANDGDLTVDLDLLMATLTGLALYDKPADLLTYAEAARQAVIDRLASRRVGPGRHAWIVGGYPSFFERDTLAARLGADVVVLAVAADECMRRIDADDRRKVTPREEWQRAVENWWRRYSAGVGETVYTE